MRLPRTRILGVALAACLSAVPVFAADTGTTGAAFLKLAPGARPAGMGEAFSAVADDVHAVYYNPAGLARLVKAEATGMHHSHFEGIRYEFAALALPLLAKPDTYGSRASRGTLAFAVYNLSASGLERRGVTETDAPTGNFGAADLAYSAAYGFSLSSAASVGAAVKYVDQTLDGVQATALALDAGALWRKGRLSLAAGMRNFGTAPKFRDQSDPLPRVLYAGLAAPLGKRWLAAADLRLPRERALAVSVGTEYWHPFDHGLKAFLRGGLSSGNRDGGGLAGIGLGAGVGMGALRFDFAWVPFGELGNTFRYSLHVRF